MTNHIPVERDDLQTTVVAHVAYDDFAPDLSPAEPTSRVIDGSRDHGWDEEWIQCGTVTIDGIDHKSRMVFLFDLDDIEGDDPNYWPWEERAARIVLD